MYLTPSSFCAPVDFLDFETIEESSDSATLAWKTIYTVAPPAFAATHTRSDATWGSPDGKRLAVYIPDRISSHKKDSWLLLNTDTGRWVQFLVTKCYQSLVSGLRKFFFCGDKIVITEEDTFSLRYAPYEQVFRNSERPNAPTTTTSSMGKLHKMATDDWRDIVYLDSEAYHSLKTCQDGSVVPTPVASAHRCLLNQYEYFQRALSSKSAWDGTVKLLRHRKDGPVIEMLCLPFSGATPTIIVVIDYIYERLDMSEHAGSTLIYAAGEYLMCDLMRDVFKYVTEHGSIEQMCEVYGNMYNSAGTLIIEAEELQRLLEPLENTLACCSTHASTNPAMISLADNVRGAMLRLFERTAEMWSGAGPRPKKRRSE